jgi:hypothetical protein
MMMTMMMRTTKIQKGDEVAVVKSNENDVNASVDASVATTTAMMSILVQRGAELYLNSQQNNDNSDFFLG